MSDYSNNYKQRNAGVNVAEELYTMFLEQLEIPYIRLGIDEKEWNRKGLDKYWEIHPIVRSLPDFIIMIEGQLQYHHVKGTGRFKIVDLENYLFFEEKLAKGIPVYVSFMFEGQEQPITKTLKWVEDQAKVLPRQKYPDNGKECILLNLISSE